MKTTIAREIRDTGIITALEKTEFLTSHRMAELHGSKMDGPRNKTEAALLDINDTCCEALNRLRPLLDDLTPFLDADRFTHDLTSASVVVDLGGYYGDFTAAIHEKYGCRVFCFEPVAHFFGHCQRRFRHASAARVLNYAIGGENGTVKGVERADSSGLYATDGCGRWEAGMITMDVALEKIGEFGADLLAVNIEGSEFPLLEDMAKKDLVRRFKSILIQWHDCAPDAVNRYEVLQQILRKTHHLELYDGWMWQNWRRNE